MFGGVFSRVVVGLALLGWFLPLNLRAQQRYTLVDLGEFIPAAVNDAGHVAGTAGGFAYLYKNGAFTPLGAFGGNGSRSTALNNRDEVVGAAANAEGRFHPFLYTGNTLIDLVPTASSGQGTDINDSGVIIGQHEQGQFIYTNGAFSSVPIPAGYSSPDLRGINNRGEIVGRLFRSGAQRAFLYSGGIVTDIGTLGGLHAVPNAINDRGEIVGRSHVNFDVEHAFLFSAGIWRDLGILPQASRSEAHAINNHGQVVGTSAGPNVPQIARAFIYENGQMIDLNTQVDVSTSSLTALNIALSISDTGYIVGYGRDSANALRGFLLKPIVAPTPAWWTARGVIDPSKLPIDFAVANQGQAKNLARKAFDELEARLPGGAGPVLAQMIASWSNGASARDYAVINQGQLKQLAKPFYDRLAEVGYEGPPLVAGQRYPWTDATADDNDFAAAATGQLKLLFSFDLDGAAAVGSGSKP